MVFCHLVKSWVLFPRKRTDVHTLFCNDFRVQTPPAAHPTPAPQLVRENDLRLSVLGTK